MLLRNRFVTNSEHIMIGHYVRQNCSMSRQNSVLIGKCPMSDHYSNTISPFLPVIMVYHTQEAQSAQEVLNKSVGELMEENSRLANDKMQSDKVRTIALTHWLYYLCCIYS